MYILASVHSGKCTFGEMSIRPNVHSGKCQFWKISFRGNVHSVKCTFWKVYVEGNVFLESVFLGNVLSGRCKDTYEYVYC